MSLAATGDAISETIDAAASDGRQRLLAYRQPRVWSSLWQLGVTSILFVAFWIAAWRALSIGYWLTLLCAVPAGLMAVRLFILQHDCGHGSFFKSPTANRIVGIGLSVITMTPYECWRRQHALHHATNAQLDHRGVGDIRTWTLTEYAQASRFARLRYRLYRHPLILFVVGPPLHFGILQRFTFTLPDSWRRERQSVWLTNGLLAAAFAIMIGLVGPWPFLAVHVPVCVVASSIGVLLFYLQHQFEHTYWEHDGAWDYQRAAMEGSSYLALPRALHWLTANIGYHHIHHLDSRIPNYALDRCFRANEDLRQAPHITLAGAISCLKLKLWDEQGRRLLTMPEARRQLKHLRESSAG